MDHFLDLSEKVSQTHTATSWAVHCTLPPVQCLKVYQVPRLTGQFLDFSVPHKSISILQAKEQVVCTLVDTEAHFLLCFFRDP